MPIDNKQFHELIAEDLSGELDGEEDLGNGAFEKQRLVSSAILRNSLLGSYSAQRVVNYPFAFDIQKGQRNGDILILQDHPEIPFKGEALLLWGISEETRVHSLRSGNTEAIAINPTPVPAILYHCPGEVGETLESIRLGKYTPQFCQWVNMAVATPAIRITLEISGPVTHAVLMGKGLAKCMK